MENAGFYHKMTTRGARAYMAEVRSASKRRPYADAWIEKAEDVADNTPAGYDVTVEVDGFASKSGNPVVIDCPRKWFRRVALEG